VLFKTSDIPEIDLWRGFKSNQGLGDLTPEDALKAVIQYCDIATDTSSAWKEALETGMMARHTSPPFRPRNKR
jgi:hypothetical protein